MSVGHVQRAVEAAGIPTAGIYISAFGHVPSQMSVPRAIITPHPLGRTLGAPGDSDGQIAVLTAALDLFNAPGPTIRQWPSSYRPATPPPTT